MDVKFPNHKVSQSEDPGDYMRIKCLSHSNNIDVTVCFIKMSFYFNFGSFSVQNSIEMKWKGFSADKNKSKEHQK